MAEPKVPAASQEPGDAQTSQAPLTDAMSVGTPSGVSVQAAGATAAPLPFSDWIGPTPSTDLSSSAKGRAYLDLVLRDSAGPQGFWEAAKPGVQDLPFVGDVAAGVDLAKVPLTLHRIKNGQPVSDDDVIELNYFVKRSQREANRTWLGTIGAGIKGLVQFGTEFAATAALVGAGLLAAPASGGATAAGAVGAAASIAGKKGVVKAAKEAAEAAVTDLTQKLVAKEVRAAGTRTAAELAKDQAVRFAWTRSQAAFRGAQKEIGDKMRGIVVDAIGDKASAKVANIAGKVASGVAQMAAPAAAMLAVDEAVNVVAAGVTGNAPTTLGQVNREIEQVLSGKTVDHVSAKVFELGDRFVEYFSEMSGPFLGKAVGGVAKTVAPGATQAALDWGQKFSKWADDMWGQGITKTAGELTEAGKTYVAQKKWGLAAGAYLGALSAKYGVDLEAAAGMFKAGGYDGFLEEMGEERLGGFVRGLTGIQGGDWGLRNAFDQMLPPIEDLATEAVVFATPLAMAGGLHLVHNTEWAGGQGIKGLYTNIRKAKQYSAMSPDAVVTEADSQQHADGIVEIIQAQQKLEHAKDKKVFNGVLGWLRSLVRLDVAGMQYSGFDDAAEAHGMVAYVDAYERAYAAAKQKRRDGTEPTDAEAEEAARTVIRRIVDLERQVNVLRSQPEQQGPPAPSRGTARADLLREANDWDKANKISRSDAWFEGGKVDAAATNGWNEAMRQGGERLQAHGMSKERTLGGAIKNLLGLLENGLDMSRRNGQLDTAPLVSKPGEGLVGATASGSAYNDGPFILVAKPGQALQGNLSGLGAVLVNQANAHLVDKIRAEIQSIRPDIHVSPFSEAGAITEALHKGTSAIPAAAQRPNATPAAAQRPSDAETAAKLSEAARRGDLGLKLEDVGGKRMLTREPAQQGELAQYLGTTAEIAEQVLSDLELNTATRTAAQRTAAHALNHFGAAGISARDLQQAIDDGGRNPAIRANAMLALGLDPRRKDDVVTFETAAPFMRLAIEKAKLRGVKLRLVGTTGIVQDTLANLKTVFPGYSDADLTRSRTGENAQGEPLFSVLAGALNAGGEVVVGMHDSMARTTTGQHRAGLYHWFEDVGLEVGLGMDAQAGALGLLRRALLQHIDTQGAQQGPEVKKLWGTIKALLNGTPAQQREALVKYLSVPFKWRQDTGHGESGLALSAEVNSLPTLEQLFANDAASLQTLQVEVAAALGSRSPDIQGTLIGDWKLALQEWSNPYAQAQQGLREVPDVPAATTGGALATGGKPTIVVPGGEKDEKEKGRQAEVLNAPAGAGEKPAPAESAEDQLPGLEPPAPNTDNMPVAAQGAAGGAGAFEDTVSEADQRAQDRINKLRGVPPQPPGASLVEDVAAIEQRFRAARGVPIHWYVLKTLVLSDHERAQEIRSSPGFAALWQQLLEARGDEMFSLARDLADYTAQPQARAETAEGVDAEAAAEGPEEAPAAQDQGFDVRKEQTRFWAQVLRQLGVTPAQRSGITKYLGQGVLRQAWNQGSAEAAAKFLRETAAGRKNPGEAKVLLEIAARLEETSEEGVRFDLGSLVSLDSMSNGRVVPHLAFIQAPGKDGRITVKEYTQDIRFDLEERATKKVRGANLAEWRRRFLEAKNNDTRAALITRMFDLPVPDSTRQDAVSPVLTAHVDYRSRRAQRDVLVPQLVEKILAALEAWNQSARDANAQGIAENAIIGAFVAPVINRNTGARIAPSVARRLSENVDPRLVTNKKERAFLEDLIGNPLRFLGPRSTITAYRQPSALQRALESRGHRVAVVAGGSQARYVDDEGRGESVLVRESFDGDGRYAMPGELLDAGFNTLYDEAVDSGKPTVLKWAGAFGENGTVVAFEDVLITAKNWMSREIQDRVARYARWREAVPAGIRDSLMHSEADLRDMAKRGDWRLLNAVLGMQYAQALVMGNPGDYTSNPAKFIAEYRKRLGLNITPAYRFVSGVPDGLPDDLPVAVYGDPELEIDVVGKPGEKVKVKLTDGFSVFVGKAGQMARRSLGSMLVKADHGTLKTLHKGVPADEFGTAFIGKESMSELDLLAQQFPESVFAALRDKFNAMPEAERPLIVRFTSAAKNAPRDVISATPRRDTGGWTVESPKIFKLKLADMGFLFDPFQRPYAKPNDEPKQLRPGLGPVFLRNPGLRQLAANLQQEHEFGADIAAGASESDWMIRALRDLREIHEGGAEDPVIEALVARTRGISPHDQQHVAKYLATRHGDAARDQWPQVKLVQVPAGGAKLYAGDRVVVRGNTIETLPPGTAFGTEPEGTRVRPGSMAANVAGVRRRAQYNFDAKGELQDWALEGDGEWANQLQDSDDAARRAAALFMMRHPKYFEDYFQTQVVDGQRARRPGWNETLQRLANGEALSIEAISEHVDVWDLDVVDRQGGKAAVIRGGAVVIMRIPSPGLATEHVVRIDDALRGEANQAAVPDWLVTVLGSDFDVDSLHTIVPWLDGSLRYDVGLHGSANNQRGSLRRAQNALLLGIREAMTRDMLAFRLNNTRTNAEAYLGAAQQWRAAADQGGPRAPLLSPRGALDSRELMLQGERMLERAAAWIRTFNIASQAGLTFTGRHPAKPGEEITADQPFTRHAIHTRFWDQDRGEWVTETREIKIGMTAGHWDRLPLAELLDHYNTMLNMATDFAKLDGALAYLTPLQDFPAANLLMALNPELQQDGVRRYFDTVVGLLHSDAWVQGKLDLKWRVKAINDGFFGVSEFLGIPYQHAKGNLDVMAAEDTMARARDNQIGVPAPRAKRGETQGPPVTFFDTRAAFFTAAGKPNDIVPAHRTWLTRVQLAFQGTVGRTAAGQRILRVALERMQALRRQGLGLKALWRDLGLGRIDDRLSQVLVATALNPQGLGVQQIVSEAKQWFEGLPEGHTLRRFFELGAAYPGAPGIPGLRIQEALLQHAGFSEADALAAQQSFAELRPQDQQTLLRLAVTFHAPTQGGKVQGNWWWILPQNQLNSWIDIEDENGAQVPQSFWGQYARWYHNALSEAELKAAQDFVLSPTAQYYEVPQARRETPADFRGVEGEAPQASLSDAEIREQTPEILRPLLGTVGTPDWDDVLNTAARALDATAPRTAAFVRSVLLDPGVRALAPANLALRIDTEADPSGDLGRYYRRDLLPQDVRDQGVMGAMMLNQRNILGRGPGDAALDTWAVLVHEYTHAVTEELVARDARYRAEVNRIRAAALQARPELAGAYGFKGVEEFATEVFMNPRFRGALSRIQDPEAPREQPRSLWKAFRDSLVRALEDILGSRKPERSLLESGVDAILAGLDRQIYDNTEGFFEEFDALGPNASLATALILDFGRALKNDDFGLRYGDPPELMAQRGAFIEAVRGDQWDRALELAQALPDNKYKERLLPRIRGARDRGLPPQASLAPPKELGPINRLYGVFHYDGDIRVRVPRDELDNHESLFGYDPAGAHFVYDKNTGLVSWWDSGEDAEGEENMLAVEELLLRGGHAVTGHELLDARPPKVRPALLDPPNASLTAPDNRQMFGRAFAQVVGRPYVAKPEDPARLRAWERQQPSGAQLQEIRDRIAVANSYAGLREAPAPHEQEARQELLNAEAQEPSTGDAGLSLVPGLASAVEVAMSIDDAAEWIAAQATRFLPRGVSMLHGLLMREVAELNAVRKAAAQRYNDAALKFGTTRIPRGYIRVRNPDGTYGRQRVDWTADQWEQAKQYRGIVEALLEYFPSGTTEAQFSAILKALLKFRKVGHKYQHRGQERWIPSIVWGHEFKDSQGNAVPAEESFFSALERWKNSAARQALHQAGRQDLGDTDAEVEAALYAELKEAREFFDASQRRLSWLVRYRGNYVPHIHGHGFASRSLVEAHDDVKRALDALPRGIAPETTLLNDPRAYARDFTKGVPPAVQAQRDLFAQLSPATPPADWTLEDFNAAILHHLREREVTEALLARKNGTAYQGDERRLRTIKALEKALHNSRFREWTGRALERTAVGTRTEVYHNLGYKPAGLDIDVTQHRYVNDAFAAAFNRALVGQMLLQTDVDGAPLIVAVPSNIVETEELIPQELLAAHARMVLGHYGYRLDPNRNIRTQLQWAATNLVGRQRYSEVPSKFPSVAMFLAQKGAAEKILLHVIGEPKQWMVGSVDVLEQLHRVTQWSKITSVGWSVFFPIALLESVVAGTGIRKNILWSPASSAKQIREIWKGMNTPGSETRDLENLMTRAGIQLSEASALDEAHGVADQDVERVFDWVRRHHGPQAATWARHVLRGWQGRWLSEKFFGDLFPAFKLWAAQRLMEESARQSGTDISTEDGKLAVLRRIAPIINDAYGGQFWDRYIWATPQVRQMLNLLMFAPNWTLSAWNIAGGGLLTGRALGNPMTTENTKFVFLQNWPAMAAIVMIGVPAALQMAIWALTRGAGDPDDKPFPLMNEVSRGDAIDITPVVRLMPGYEGDPTGRRRFYMRFGKQAQEVVGDSGWLFSPVSQLLRKLSQPARAVLEQLTGRSPGSDFALEFKGQGMLGWIKSQKPGWEGLQTSRLGYLASKFVPMSVLTWSKTPEAAVAAFIAPVSKGMSMGRATEALVKVLNTYANQEVMTRLDALQPAKANLEALAPAVLDAAARNGYDPKKVLDAARGVVMGRLYGEFWKALNAGDTKAMDGLAIPILRLHGTLEGLAQSMANREKQFRRPLTPEQTQAAADVFNRALSPIAPPSPE